MYIVQRALAFTAAPRRSALTTLGQRHYRSKAMPSCRCLPFPCDSSGGALKQTARVNSTSYGSRWQGSPGGRPPRQGTWPSVRPSRSGRKMEFVSRFVKLAHRDPVLLHSVLKRLLLAAKIYIPSTTSSLAVPRIRNGLCVYRGWASTAPRMFHTL